MKNMSNTNNMNHNVNANMGMNIGIGVNSSSSSTMNPFKSNISIHYLAHSVFNNNYNSNSTKSTSVGGVPQQNPRNVTKYYINRFKLKLRCI